MKNFSFNGESPFRKDSNSDKIYRTLQEFSKRLNRNIDFREAQRIVKSLKESNIVTSKQDSEVLVKQVFKKANDEGLVESS